MNTSSPIFQNRLLGALSVCLLCLGTMGTAWAAPAVRDIEQHLLFQTNPDTVYDVQWVDAKQALTVTFLNPPEDLASQITRTLGPAVASYTIESTTEDKLQVAFYLRPGKPKLSHSRTLEPSTVTISIKARLMDYDLIPDIMTPRFLTQEALTHLPIRIPSNLKDPRAVRRKQEDQSEEALAALKAGRFEEAKKIFNQHLTTKQTQVEDQSRAGILRAEYEQVLQGKAVNPTVSDHLLQSYDTLRNARMRQSVLLMLGHLMLLDHQPEQAERLLARGYPQADEDLQPYYAILLARALLTLGKKNEADRFLKRHEPWGREAWAMAHCLTRSWRVYLDGDAGKAVEHMNQCGSSSQDHTKETGDFYRAQLLAIAKRYPQSDQEYFKVINGSHYDADYLYASVSGYADLLTLLGRREEARRWLDQAINSSDKAIGPESEGWIRLLMLKRRMLSPDVNVENEISRYLAVSEDPPSRLDLMAQFYRATFADLTAKPKDAYEAANKILKTRKGRLLQLQNPEWFNRILVQYYRDLATKKDWSSLVYHTSLNEWGRLDGLERQEVLSILAEALLQRGMNGRAITMMHELLKHLKDQPSSRHVLKKLVSTYLRQKDTYRAGKTVEYYQSLFSDKPEDKHYIHEARAQIYESTEEMNKLVDELNTLLESTTNPDKRFEILIKRARVQEQLGDDAGMERSLREAVGIAPTPMEKADLLRELGLRAYMREEFKQCAKDLRGYLAAIANTTEPVGDVLFTLGFCNQQLSKAQESIKVLEKAIAVAPEDSRVPYARYAIAQQALAANDTKRAQEQLAQLKQTGEEFWQGIGDFMETKAGFKPPTQAN